MRFGLLGNLTVQDDSGGALTLRSPKGRTLLAVLLLHPNRPVSRDRLVGALWGERPPATAVYALSNQVAQLRRFLGPDGVDRLRTVSRGYLLRVGENELDTADFTDRLAAAGTSRGRRDWLDVSEHTAAALTLWRGDPLGDLPALAEQELPYLHSLQEARLQLADWHFEAELRLGRHRSAILELARWAAQYPLHEAFHVQLITALYRSGRQADALAAFEDIRVRLGEELGVDPGPALHAVHQQVLLADPALLWRPESVQPVFADAPHGTDITADSVGNGSTSLDSDGQARVEQSRLMPSQLPADTADFTGRTDELKALIGHLTAVAAGGMSRVLVVAGMGGVGKTALAVRAAHRAGHLFPDGQLYVDLRGFGPGEPREAHDVLAGLLADLGRADGSSAQTRPIPAHTDDRAALLRTVLAERRVLLMLDNARDAEQVLPFLPGGGRSAVVVTSRNTLSGLPSAVHLALDPMDVEEQRALLSALCGTTRVRQDPDGALRVLAACAGLPLALRITGARLAARPAWSLSVLAQQLGTGSRRLRGMSAGHLGVRATFESSYHALRDSARPSEREAARAFRLLGLWPGFLFSVESAAAVIGRPTETTADLLELLVDYHLLQSTEPLRYRFHDLLAEYSAERVAEEETAEARDTARVLLMLWYARGLENACAAMTLGVQEPPTLDETSPTPPAVFDDAEGALHWCAHELPNIKEAIRQAAHCSRPDLAWRLATWLFGYARTYWWTGEWDECLYQALHIAEQHGDELGQAWILRRLGACHGMAERSELATEALRASLKIFEKAGDTSSQAAVLGNLSMAHEQPDQALAYAREAFRLHRKSGDKQGEVAYHECLAHALYATGDLPAAESHFRQALAFHRRAGNLHTVGVNLTSLGETLQRLDRREDALAALEESLDVRERLGDAVGIVDCLVVTGRTHLHFGERDAARMSFDRALDLAREHRMDAYIDQAREGLDAMREVTRTG